MPKKPKKKRLTPKQGRAIRDKGIRGEREVITLLRAVLGEGFTVQRVLTETRSGSHDIDIHHFGFDFPIGTVQVKNVESRFGNYLLQAWREANEGTADQRSLPIGVVKVPVSTKAKRRGLWLAVVDLENLMAAVRQALR
jgi:hypothetical protein